MDLYLIRHAPTANPWSGGAVTRFERTDRFDALNAFLPQPAIWYPPICAAPLEPIDRLAKGRSV